jgi:uncharacterized lipoprotein YmbA
MMMLTRLSLTLLMLGFLGLTGCTQFAPVSLYQLDAGASVGKQVDPNGVSVLLGPILVADYLRHEALLQRQDDGTLVPAHNARWAGNLASDLDHQVLRQLAARIDSQRLVLASEAPGFKAQVQVQLSISRLDSGPHQPVVLEAQWRLLGREGQLLDTRLVRLQEAHQGSVADQVRAQSLALQKLVEKLSDALQRSVAAAVASEEPRKKPALPAAREEPPKMPAVQPIRIEAEVFRF